jgi:methyl-accepting chemotaxis protein WspA
VYRREDAEAYGAKRWQALKAGVSELLESAASADSNASFTKHTRLIQETGGIVGQVADVSKLILDPQLDSYYLMITLLTEGPQLSEYLAQARVLAAPPPGGASADRIEKARGTLALVTAADERLAASLASAMSADPALTPVLNGRARAVAQQVRQAREELAAQLLTGEPHTAAAANYIALTTTPALTQLQAQLAPSLRTSLQKRMDSYTHQLRNSLLIALVAFLVVLAVGFYIVRSITRPLAQVVSVANQIAVGNLNVEAIDGHRRDEIGALARAFERMMAALREQVLLVQDIAEGDLTGTVKPQSANDDMGNALSDMVRHLAALVSEVHRSGIQVNTSATQISATAREQHSTATEIAATTTEIGATSKEISATSKELVRTMNEVASAAEHSAQLANTGQHGLTQMEETMHRVMDATGSINAKLAVLNEKAGNITQVVTTITRVADQTNLLSLNAAIEAEKAGEYGKGFSVVATEIRRLADQTAVATYDIEQMVREIQSAVSAGVMGMDKFSEEVRRGMEVVEQVGSQLSQIIAQVQQMAPRCEAASEGMRAQATGAEQITQALSQLSEAALQTVESLRQSNQAIDGLHQSATGLRDGVSRFKLAN